MDWAPEGNEGREVVLEVRRFGFAGTIIPYADRIQPANPNETDFPIFPVFFTIPRRTRRRKKGCPSDSPLYENLLYQLRVGNRGLRSGCRRHEQYASAAFAGNDLIPAFYFDLHLRTQ
jgi:hypothetical protein